MKHEFNVKRYKNATVYTLESATGGATSAGSVTSNSMTVGGVRKRGDNLIAQEDNKDKVPATTPRNFVAKNAKTSGAGAHKDKKKAEKQGDFKHKKSYADALQEKLNNIASEDHTTAADGWGRGAYDTYAGGRHGRGVAEEDDAHQEIGMAGSELYGAAKHAKQLLALIQQHGEHGLEAWQQSKITKAADYLNSVLQSLDYDTTTGEQDVAEGTRYTGNGIHPKLVEILKQRGYKGPYQLGKLKKWFVHLKDDVNAQATDEIMVTGNDVEYDEWVLKEQYGEYAFGSEGGYMTGDANRVIKNTAPMLEQGVAETTGDPKFDKMLKGITGKKVVAKQQKADTKQQSRDAFSSMFGGGNPTDTLSIRKKGVAEDSPRQLPKRHQSAIDAFNRFMDEPESTPKDELQLRHDQTKNRIKTNTMAGPKGVLPEQGVEEANRNQDTNWRDEADREMAPDRNSPYYVFWTGQSYEWYGDDDPESGEGRYKPKGDSGEIVAINIKDRDTANTIAKKLDDQFNNGSFPNKAVYGRWDKDYNIVNYEGAHVKSMRKMGGYEKEMMQYDLRQGTVKDYANQSSSNTDSYMESLLQKLAEKIPANAPVDVWVKDFQKADPNKYHQFKNKTPEKKSQMAAAASYLAKNPNKKK